ncbi:hypothetical protein GCM10010960_05260 [Arenimonas maotaiensis]|uniref:BioF2-like acetyltransferase domain-containing protein n=2 Tax=Arenimonas maotaiensis TaxID=1446479 RepID=A0A917FKB2_9GAMM|nr:hypothetical protein GCM10010960_05260 [Arenimonas maotaiensis]
MDINTGTYDGYLQSLSKNRRGYIRKKQRALESEFKIESVFSKSEDVYLSVFDETFEIQKLRWGTTRPRRSHEYMQAVRDSNSELFRDSLMAFLGIRANGRLISYRLGFIHENCFYDWNTSYDPGFEKFSPGALSIAYLVEKLIDEGVHKIDFMAGYYDYKLSYSPDPRIYENKLYVLCGSSLKARFVAWYFLYGRDKAKQVYSRIRDYRLVKWIRS